MNTTTSPMIGIVSGIGPLAGSDVFAKVIQYAAQQYGAVEDNEYPDVLLLNHGINGVDNLASLHDTFEQEIIRMVRELESQGATIIGIACNTAHIYWEDIRVKPGTKLVNLIDAVAESAKAAEQSNYLLLTSNASKQQQLYHSYLEKHGVSFQETNAQQQQLLDKAIGLVMAYKLDEAGAVLDTVLASAKADGHTAVIAGCTELPIAIAHSPTNHGLELIDANAVLAQSLLRNYYAYRNK